MHLPHVYIILPVYNGGDFFVQQLYTIQSQTYTNRTLIIINDGSTNDTLKIISDFISRYNLKEKIIIYNQENTGQYFACGVGLQKVKELCKGDYEGEYIAYCDADDLWTNNKLQDQINFMRRNSNCDLSYHDCRLIDENNQIIGDSSLRYFSAITKGKKIKSTNFFEICMGQCMISTSMMFKAKWIDKILPVCPTFSQDWRVSLILSGNNASIKLINNKYGFYRIHTTSSLQKKKKTQTYLDWMKCYEKALLSLKGRIVSSNDKKLSYVINQINLKIKLLEHKISLFRFLLKTSIFYYLNIILYNFYVCLSNQFFKINIKNKKIEKH